MTTVDDYVEALERELRDQPRSIRRREAAGLREHLDELPPDALARLDAPAPYAQEYRTQRDLRSRRLAAWRRLSWPARVAIVAVAVALVVAIGVGTEAGHYQPLTVDVNFSRPGGISVHQVRDETVYSFREGGTLWLGMDVRNTGRFDATLTSLLDEGELGPMKLVAMGVSTPPHCCTAADTHATHFPIRVPAHSVRTVLLTFRLTTCKYGSANRGNGGYSAGIAQFFFTMKTLGVHHRIVVPFPEFWIDVPNPLPPCASTVTG
jgi:hypothetical protein